MKVKTKIQNHAPIWPDWLKSRLAKLEGKDVLVEIKQVKNIRSLNANAYYWVCLTIIAKETGHNDEELHKLFKGMFLPKREITLNNKKYYLSGSTTQCSTWEFMQYIEKIRGEVGQMGISLPSTEDYKKGLDEAVLLVNDLQ